MPARMTEIGVGACTWASGSQVWNGKQGILIAKAMNKNQKAQVVKLMPSRSGPVQAPALPMAIISGIEKVPWSRYIAISAISIRTEPARVYRKNLIAAYSRLGPPQIPIRKYMGSSITSQNT
jgi:hypothetical protein